MINYTKSHFLRVFFILIAIRGLLFSTLVYAADYRDTDKYQLDWKGKLIQEISKTWEQPQNYDLYFPVLSWHNRFTYDKEKTDKYNEMPWGIGGGISRYNEQGNWSALYAMIFKDSHNEWQPSVGYVWEKGWYLDENQYYRIGSGFTIGVTARRDFANYVPLPLALPVFSASYKYFNVQFTYIPGTYNNGNVLFAWLRYDF